ncbi:MAG: ferritin-like protein [Phycisphaerales bacterium]|nr:ferritin-like protein [Phycisphaerales bacterium]
MAKTTKKTKTKKPGFKEITEHMTGMLGEAGEQLERRHGREELDHACLACLKEALQLAIDLEFSTIPPYLAALWSIKDDLHPAAKSIREVVQEEMLHMALACNMLTAIGGQPKITADPPAYPTELPGDLHPGLRVELEGLNNDSLRSFMHIELPNELFELDPNDDWKVEIPTFPTPCTTIGVFYEKLHALFELLDPPFSRDRQVTGPLSYANIGNLAGVKWAIELISNQGEGSTKSPFEDEAGTDLSHFYRFEQVFMRAELKWSQVKKCFNKGQCREFPDTWPMGRVPRGGYVDSHLKGLNDEDRAVVASNLTKFDQVYSHLLNLLQSTWGGGGQRSLIQAYETMFELERYAKPLMKVLIPGGDGKTFGPCFRYTEHTS